MFALRGYPMRRDRVLVQQGTSDTVLLNLDSGQYYALGEVGGRVWQLCDGTRSVSDLVSEIHQEFDAPTETIEADLLELLDDLAHEKLVVEAK